MTRLSELPYVEQRRALEDSTSEGNYSGNPSTVDVADRLPQGASVPIRGYFVGVSH